jgi:Fe(3+) dicitrate transport protein
MLKTKYDLSARDQLTGNFHYYTATAGMPGGLTPEQYRENPFQSVRPFDQFEGRRQDMSFRYRHMGDESQFEVLTYFTKSFRTSDIQNDGTGANEGQSRFVAAPRHYTTWAIEPTWSRLFHFLDMAHEVTLGYRYLNETQDEKAYRSDWYDPASTWSAPDSKQNYYQHTSGGTAANAFYIDDAINVGNWTITPGLRYESIRTHVRDSFADIDRQKSYSEPLPSLNVMYHLSDSWKLFANANTSFGSLQYAQLTRGGNHGQPAPGLKPEKARTYEIGTRYDDTVLKAELTAFYIDFDNQLQYINNTVGWTTLGATRHQGVELAFNYDLSDVATALDGASVYSTYTYTRAVSTSGDFANKDLPLYSRQVFTVGGRYATGNWVWSLDGYSQSGQQSPGSATDGNGYITKESEDGQYGYIPGYMVWGARGEYDMGPAWHNLKLAAGIKNLLDKRYFTRSTDNNYGKYVGEPRTYYLQASVSF